MSIRSPAVPTSPAGRGDDRESDVSDVTKSVGGEGYPNPPVPPSLYDFSSIEVASAGPGKSISLGSLSVPPSWPTPASKAEPVSLSPSAADSDAAPADPKSKPRGRAYREALMAAMTERRAISDAADGNQDDEDGEDGRLKE
jgi:PPE-SVP subfamily C-terminal region